VSKTVCQGVKEVCLHLIARSEILDVLHVYQIIQSSAHASAKNQMSDSVGGVEMQVEADITVDINRRQRIWFFPDKFWQATKGMPAEEVSKLMEEVEKHAEAKDVEALKNYPFVFVGDPYKGKSGSNAA